MISYDDDLEGDRAGDSLSYEVFEVGNNPERTFTQAEVKATVALFAQRVAVAAKNAPLRPHADNDYDYHSGCVQTRERILEAIEKVMPNPSALDAHDREHDSEIASAIRGEYPSIPMEIGDALAKHDAALAQKLLNSFTEQTANLEADNAKLREELDWALGIVQVSPARLNKSQDERYSQARALLAEPPETQGKETT